jgi:hypothetical protein
VFFIYCKFQNIPHENSLAVFNGTRPYSTLIPITISRGLLGECIAYRKAKILVSNWFNFRDKISPEDQLKLSTENCSDQQFTCVKGPAISRPITRCIDRKQQCDRIIHCEDKSDELSCNGNFQSRDCPTDFEKCPDGGSCYRKDGQTCGMFI